MSIHPKRRMPASQKDRPPAEVPDWFEPIEQVEGSLTIWNLGSDCYEELEITLEEYNALKLRLAELRGAVTNETPASKPEEESAATIESANASLGEAPDVSEPVTQAELEACCTLVMAAWRYANSLALRLEAGALLEPGAIRATPDEPQSWNQDTFQGFDEHGLRVQWEGRLRRVEEIVAGLSDRGLRRVPIAVELLANDFGTDTPVECMLSTLLDLAEDGPFDQRRVEHTIAQLVENFDGFSERISYAAQRYSVAAREPIAAGASNE
jgi:hypothetical protein